MKLLISLSGIAKSGKDSYCQLLIKKLNSLGYSARRYALADPLKADLYFFVKQFFNLDIYKCSPKDKEFLRPLMVLYGKMQRERSEGRYWTKILEDKLKSDQSDIIIVTDCRYDSYKEDELFWVKNRTKGVLVHLSRYIDDPFFIPIENGESGRRFIEPPNEDEKVNDPKLKAAADLKFEIPTVLEDKIEETINKYVEELILWLKTQNKLPTYPTKTLSTT